jgi:hypothetical protein
MPYENIGEVPWESVEAGHIVLVHWKATPYYEKWVVCREGSVGSPIVIKGVPGSGGQRPVLSGQGATTRPQLNFWNESRGIIKVGGANNPPDCTPAFIVIENLEIRSGRPPYSFWADDGYTSYASNCAAIYVEKGYGLALRNCALADCGNGLFTSWQSDRSDPQQISPFEVVQDSCEQGFIEIPAAEGQTHSPDPHRHDNTDLRQLVADSADLSPRKLGGTESNPAQLAEQHIGDREKYSRSRLAYPPAGQLRGRSSWLAGMTIGRAGYGD